MVVTNEVRNTRAEWYFSILDMWSSVREMVSIFQNAGGPWKLMFWTPMINWETELCLEVEAALFFWDKAQSYPNRNTAYWQSFVLKALEESVHAALGRLAVFVSAAVTNVCCHVFPKETTSQTVNSGKRARKPLAFLFSLALTVTVTPLSFLPSLEMEKWGQDGWQFPGFFVHM